jgi:molybdopterin synthase sulfur carrier subunit
MAKVFLPRNLSTLFPRLPRETDVAAETVGDTISRLNDQWPGLRNRLIESGPSLREHIAVFVDGEKAGLTSPVQENSIVRIVPAITGGEAEAH